MARNSQKEEPKLKFLITDYKNNTDAPNRTIQITFLNKVGVDNLTSIGPFTREELKELRRKIKDFLKS